MFKGKRLASDGTGQVCLSDIGNMSSPYYPTKAGDALVCVTEYAACCQEMDGTPGGMGQWYINGVEVPDLITMDSNAASYRNRGTGMVRLNVRAGHILTQAGDYCCRIPDSNGDMQKLCVQGTLGSLANYVH